MTPGELCVALRRRPDGRVAFLAAGLLGVAVLSGCAPHHPAAASGVVEATGRLGERSHHHGPACVPAELFVADPNMEAGTISLRVIDDSGLEIPLVSVQLYRTESGRLVSPPLRSTATDGRGIVQFSAVPSGTYDVIGHMAGFPDFHGRLTLTTVGVSGTAVMAFDYSKVEVGGI